MHAEESLALACGEPHHCHGAKISYLKLALTNFFDLSNIRFDSGGPLIMFGASRCLRKVLFQFGGRPALRADWSFSCDFSTHFIFRSKKLFAISFSLFRRARRFLGTSSVGQRCARALS